MRSAPAMVGAAAQTYASLGQSLLELQDAADRIFDAITTRVGLEHRQLKSLSARIISAQAKVDAISGTKRATTVFSSAKFPQADPSATDFIPLFSSTREGQNADTVTLSTGYGQSQEQGTLELFQFFSETSHEYWLKDHKLKDGIGKVPAGVKSVADVLLFNSTELPYHRFRVVDNLAGADQLVDQEELLSKPAALPAAPQSVLAGDVLPRAGAEEFGFKPVLRPVPSFSLPTVLPDLPMIAEISWSGMSGGIDQFTSIAPSALYGGVLSPRSNYSSSPRFNSASTSRRFEPASSSTSLDLASASRSFVPVSTRCESVSLNGSLPGMEALQGGSAQVKATKSGSSDSSSGSSDQLSPRVMLQNTGVKEDSKKGPLSPPTPPPPPKSLQLGIENQPSSISSPGQSLPAIDSQRAALMSSIRSSGISLLRKTGDQKSETFAAKKDVEILDKISSPSGKQPINVMAEMARSLTLRRLSMRGASRDQGAIRNEAHVSPIDEAENSNESGDDSKLTLPELHAYITRKNEEQSDDDDWE